MIANINKPTPAKISQLIAFIAVVQMAMQTQPDVIPYSIYINFGLGIVIGWLALFTGQKADKAE